MRQSPTSAKDLHKIRGLLQRSTFEPPVLNSIVDEIFYSTQGSNLNIRVLTERIQEDEKLTSAILQICRLPYYSGETPIRNLNQVVQRLGPNGLRSVAMQAYLDIEIYSSETWPAYLQQLRTYSLIVAHISRVIARYTPVDGDQAFLCGLLHRLGFAVGLNKLTAKNDEVDEIWQVLQVSHPIFGKMVLQEWGLQKEIQESVAHYGQVLVNGQLNLLNATILLSEEIARRFGFDIRPPRKPKQDLDALMRTDVTKTIKALEVDDDLMRKIYMDAHFVLAHGLQLNL